MVDEVGPRDSKPRPPLGRVLEPVERDVEVASLERRDEIRPLDLVEASLLQPELAGERRGDVDLEAHDPRRVPRVLEDVGLAPLQIARPYELSSLADGRQRVGPRRACNREPAHAIPIAASTRAGVTGGGVRLSRRRPKAVRAPRGPTGGSGERAGVE